MNSPHKFDHVTTGKKNTDGKKSSSHFIDLDSSGKLHKKKHMLYHGESKKQGGSDRAGWNCTSSSEKKKLHFQHASCATTQCNGELFPSTEKSITREVKGIDCASKVNTTAVVDSRQACLANPPASNHFKVATSFGPLRLWRHGWQFKTRSTKARCTVVASAAVMVKMALLLKSLPGTSGFFSSVLALKTLYKNMMQNSHSLWTL